MKMQLFGALLPLVLFWAIEELWGLKAALVVGCVAAVGEVGWEKWKTGKVSFLTLSSNALVLGLGGISFWMDSGVAFKLQPAVMEAAMGIMMLGMRFRGGEPFMIRTFRSAPMLDAEKREAVLKQEWFVKRLRGSDTRLILFLFFHGVAVAWAAVYSSSRVWILLKGVLFYVLLVLVMLPMYRRPHASGIAGDGASGSPS
ncbi:MAG: septation protein IspZ [Deltaproteobacteria bacterium]|nr:septation protein IspZ [Deltaproteobacteria bacterium]